MKNVLYNSKILVSFIVLLLIPLTINASIIESVSISPENPTESSNIQATVIGLLSQSNEVFLNHKITISSNSITIDEYFFAQGIGLAIVSPWADYCNIGNLSAGDYTLTVNNYSIITPSLPYPPFGMPGNLDDYNIDQATLLSSLTDSFTVVPEPATLLLLASGSMALLRKNRK